MNKTINTVPQDNNSGDEDKDVFDAIFPPLKSSHPDKRHEKTACRPDHGWWWNNGIHTAALLAVLAYTTVAALQWKANEKAAVAAKSAADTARDALVLSERPWVKIKHRVVKPLAFNVAGNGGLIDSMVVEDTLENVGQSVALHVFSWEDVIPIDVDSSLRTARARQDQWCDASRHRDMSHLSGYMLFPKDPFVQDSSIGGYMKEVTKIAQANQVVLGKVGFVVVGCVSYRSSFEPLSEPAHETKFIYYLGMPTPGGGIQPYVVPSGVANDLQLVAFPDGFSAD